MASKDQEIVAAYINGTITNNRKFIAAALELSDAPGIGIKVYWIRREIFEFMACFDLGDHWARLAKAPTIFRISSDGTYLPPARKDIP